MSDLPKKMLAAYQDMHNPQLDSVNPHFKSKFSSLKATIEAIKPVCAKHGFAYIQTQEVTDDGRHLLVSQIFDEDSNETLSTMEIPSSITDPQKKGIWLTYAKRQLAQADWFIVGEEDTDGEGMKSEEQPEKATDTKPRNTSSPQITNEQYLEIQTAFQRACRSRGEKATELLEKVQDDLGFELNAVMTQTQFKQAMLFLGGMQDG